MTTPVDVRHGDMLDVLADLDPASVDAVVCDPPYGLAFMGKGWDHAVPGPDYWTACLRVLKPGGHLLAFGGTRTAHRLTSAIEDAGFEIRDTITWLYGSGFPKSLDVSKAIDKARTEDRAPVDVVRAWLNERRLAAGFSHDAVNKHFGHASNGGGSSSAWMTNPTSRNLPTWDQWYELKGLFEFGDEMDAEVWRLNGRKGAPGDAFGEREVLEEREVADIRNGHGRAYGGAMFAGETTSKIAHQVTAPATDAARQWQGWGTALKPASEPIIVARKPLSGTVAATVLAHGTGALNIDGCRVGTSDNTGRPAGRTVLGVMNDDAWQPKALTTESHNAGRWPSNVVLTHAPDCGETCVDGCPVAELDTQSGITRDGVAVNRNRGEGTMSSWYGTRASQTGEDVGYGGQGGASRFFPTFRYQAKAPTRERPKVDGVAHPTVKPLALMRWLVRLVTPPGGLVLDPFAGSGTTGEAALLEGMRAILVERDEQYLPLIAARLGRAA